MAKIQFKAKLQTVRNVEDDSISYQYVPVPELKRAHCDMNAFRCHPKYGSYTNSDLFTGMLKRIRSDFFKNGMLKLDDIPAGVTLDTSGFLAVVSFEV